MTSAWIRNPLLLFPPLRTSGSSAGGFEITSTHTDTRTACYLYISSALVLVEKQLYSCVTFIDAIHFLIATCCTMLSCRSFHFCNWNALDVKYGISVRKKRLSIVFTILRENIFEGNRQKSRQALTHLWMF